MVDIVITHGTDTTEETAILLDLVLGDPRPIVLTDAQRPAEPRTATDPATSRMPLPWRRIPPLGDCARIVFNGLCSPLAGPPTVRPLGGRMCGACCRMTVTDAWTPILASTRARWETEDFANTALRHGGSRVRVTATAAGWVIRSATGQGVVVVVTTALWTTLPSRSEVPVDLLLGRPAQLHRPAGTAALTPVVVAMTAAAAATAPSPRRAVS